MSVGMRLQAAPGSGARVGKLNDKAKALVDRIEEEYTPPKGFWKILPWNWVAEPQLPESVAEAWKHTRHLTSFAGPNLRGLPAVSDFRPLQELGVPAGDVQELAEACDAVRSDLIVDGQDPLLIIPTTTGFLLVLLTTAVFGVLCSVMYRRKAHPTPLGHSVTSPQAPGPPRPLLPSKNLYTHIYYLYVIIVPVAMIYFSSAQGTLLRQVVLSLVIAWPACVALGAFLYVIGWPRWPRNDLVPVLADIGGFTPP
jgi:hypothetical protein